MAMLPLAGNPLFGVLGNAIPSQKEEQAVGLLGGQPNQRLSGLLSDPLFNAGIAMLTNQGPHFSDALGAGFRGAQGALQYQQDLKRQQEQDALNKRYREAQITSLNRGASAPANIQEWQYYQSLPPEDQKRYLEMKRAQQFKVQDIGGAPTAVTSQGGNIIQTPLSTPDVEREAASAMEGAKAAGKATGEARAQAQMDLPGVIQEGEQTIKLVDEMLNHPGFEDAVGAPNPFMGGFGPLGTLRGSPATDFQSRLDQLLGKQFLQAYQSLKGGGQITEVEGKKATDAMSRMKTAISEREFRQAAEDFKDVIRMGISRAQQKAHVQPAAGDNIVNWDDL